MKRLIAPLSLLFLVALVGCASTTSTGPSGSSTTSGVAASSPPEPASQGSGSTSAPVAGGTATDFCGAFKEMQTIFEATSGDPATLGPQMQAAAADMRKYAPAEIEKAANTYANVMDNIGKAAASGAVGQAAMMKAISEGMAGNGKDISDTAIWVSKNCDL